MSEATSKRALIFAAIVGLILAVAATATAQTDMPLEATESASTAPEKERPETTPEVETGGKSNPGPISGHSSTKEAVNPAKADPQAVIGEIYGALRGGQWLAAFGGILMFLVWGMRLFFGKWFDWFKTKRGGFILSLGTAILLGLGTALFAGAEIGFGLLASIVAAKWTAAGAWGHVKDVAKL